MKLERLEDRNNPGNLIPGWAGLEEHVTGHFGTPGGGDTAAVALDGGSPHVYIVAPNGNVLLNEIVFGELRAGGHVAIVPGTISGYKPGDFDHLLVTPGAGGGPVVVQFDYSEVAGKMVQTASFFAPYDQSFRGGLKMTGATINGERSVMFLPGEGGGPQLVAVNLRTHETEFSIYVGDPLDLSGVAEFEPTGGTIMVPGGQVGIVVQYGPTDQTTWYAPSRVWGLDGADLTSNF